MGEVGRVLDEEGDRGDRGEGLHRLPEAPRAPEGGAVPEKVKRRPSSGEMRT